ncbi:YcgL domain-containing protein [Thalassolituus hydrocarboniclasticus]|uniref:YcgL domain-containing protein HUF19_08220 n=1 Tax=Thalassolituus hydrocarboniclasticus TaxID=2742796 RepID=A0ABY6A9Q9_9GAMM|nr:YcgL domain-containing protein [Thalassolituus hydrocarboniclasticus]UXD87417.1 YcgL domain-containing protein [Thalassolituus hydrocarboniclasticus]
MTKVLCDVYKTKKKDETYLYVSRKDALSRVPEALLEQFGKPELAMTMILTPEKKLARADIDKVLKALDEQGFYLQMPPAKETYMLDLFCKLDKE